MCVVMVCVCEVGGGRGSTKVNMCTSVIQCVCTCNMHDSMVHSLRLERYIKHTHRDSIWYLYMYVGLSDLTALCTFECMDGWGGT